MRKRFSKVFVILMLTTLLLTDSFYGIVLDSQGISKNVGVKNVTCENEQYIVKGFGNKQRIIEKSVNDFKKVSNTQIDENESWNLKMVHAEDIDELDGKIKIAIIDSGVNYSTDLNVVVRKNFIQNNECNIMYEDPSGHGTAIAGIIAALDNEEGITGINPNVEIYSARVLDAKLEAPISRVVDAIEWAIEQDVDIINMSFGIEKNVVELEQAIEKAYDKGIMMVAAVGNGSTIAYPAAYDEVIAVGAVDENGLPVQKSACGEGLELMAPGENIISSGIFGGVCGVSGTSMAVPHVVGIASVLMELNPEMPAEYIRALMNYSANLCGEPKVYGNGIVDLQYAMQINKKFKKTYEKYPKMLSKNEAKKQKQIDKFWKEVTTTIPENKKAIEVFSGLEVVEGLWLKDESKYSGNTHSVLTEDGVDYTEMSFTTDQMTILTYACGYPDAENSGLSGAGKPYHGHLWRYNSSYNPIGNSNYIANYIFLTKVALAYGNAASIPMGAVMPYDYSVMVSDITTSSLGGKSWQEVFSAMNVNRRSNIQATSENIRLFIFGIGIHQISDVFAHSAWKNGDICERVKHTDNNWNTHADNPSYLPKRYAAAQEATRAALYDAFYNSEAVLAQFMFSQTNFGTFYLGNFSPYVEAVNSQIYNNLKTSFDKIDLDANVQSYDFEGMTYYVP